MKRVLISILTLFAVGCSSSKQNSGNASSGTNVQGSWAITGSLTSPQMGPVTYQVALVASPCSVTTPVGTFSVQGPVCFTANSNSGRGSISGSGVSRTGQGVLVGVSANPIPPGGAFNLVFVAADASGMMVEFTGSGTVTGGTIAGSGSCSASTPLCQGMTATFSGQPAQPQPPPA